MTRAMVCPPSWWQNGGPGGGGGSSTYQNIGLSSVSGSNAITATPPANWLSLAVGQTFSMLAAANNTGPVTLSIGGGAAQPVDKYNGTPLVANDLQAGVEYILVWDGNSFQVVNPGSATATAAFQNVGLDPLGGTANAITGTAPENWTALEAGQYFTMTATANNTGAVTLNIAGSGVKNLTKVGGTALGANDLVAGVTYGIAYDGTNYQVLNPSTMSTPYQSNTLTGVANADAITANLPTNHPIAYLDGMTYSLRPVTNNTGAAATLNLSGLGAKSLIKETNAGVVQLEANDMVIGGEYLVTYNAVDDRFHLINANSRYQPTGLSSVAGTNAITANGPVNFDNYASGQIFTFVPTSQNSAATTINISGKGVKNITKVGTRALDANDLVAGREAMIVYDGTQFQLINPMTGIYNGQQLTAVAGTNTITATAPPGFTAYTTGQQFVFIAAGTNTGATTINIGALGAKNITKQGTIALVSNDIVSGRAYEIVYDGTQFQLINPSTGVPGNNWLTSVAGTNTYTATGFPGFTIGVTGQVLIFQIPNTNTGASTINVNSQGAWALKKLGGTAMAAGDLVAGRIYYGINDGAGVQVLNAGSGGAAQAYDNDGLTAVAGTNTITATAPAFWTALAAGQLFTFVAAGTNTGATTLNISSAGAKNILKNGVTPLVAGDLVSGRTYVVSYDGTQFQLINPSSIVPGDGNGFKNLIMNARFRVNQYNYVSATNSTAANQYLIDRWKVTVSGQGITLTANGSGFQATAPANGMTQVVEGVNIDGGVYTLSWIGTATATVNGTAIVSGAQTASLPASTDVTITFTGGTVLNPQFELGNAQTLFQEVAYTDDLERCRRYCVGGRVPQDSASTGIPFYVEGVTGNTAGTSRNVYPIQFPTRMRAVPTILTDDGPKTNVQNGGGTNATVDGFGYAVTCSAAFADFTYRGRWVAVAEL